MNAKNLCIPGMQTEVKDEDKLEDNRVNSLCSPSQSECKVNTNFRQQKVTKVSASG